MTHSAARTRTDAGVLGSIIVFSRVVAAAEAPCWSRAMDCENAARRASRRLMPTFSRGLVDVHLDNLILRPASSSQSLSLLALGPLTDRRYAILGDPLHPAS